MRGDRFDSLARLVLRFTMFGDLKNNITTEGCWAYIGKQGGEQVVNLTPPDCMEEEKITHEILHSLGFYHEQNRADRDQHVRIIEESIMEYKKGDVIRHSQAS